MFKKSLVLLTIFAVAVFSGCQTRTSKAPSPTTPQSFQKPGVNQPSLPGTNKVPPKQLESIRTHINSIMGELDKKEWSKAKSRANMIRADISQLKASLRTAGITTGTTGTTTETPGTTRSPGSTTGTPGTGIKIPGTNIGNPGTTNKTPGTTTGTATTTDRLISLMDKDSTNLDKAIRTKKVYDSKVCANQIAKNLADVSQSYTNAVPTELDRLEYLCRQISLDAEKRDWKSAKSNLSACKNTLQTLKTKLNGKNTREFTKIYSNIDRLTRYVDVKNAKETIKYAKACFDNLQTIRKAPLKTP